MIDSFTPSIEDVSFGTGDVYLLVPLVTSTISFLVIIHASIRIAT